MTLEKMAMFCPAIRNALKNNYYELDDALFEYEDIYPVYRGIKMGKNENRPLTRADFSSQIERADPRRIDEEKRKKWELYSCSCFMSKRKLYERYEPIRKDPDRFRYAIGIIRKQNGAVIIEPDSEHIHWFLYDNCTPENDFKVV